MRSWQTCRCACVDQHSSRRQKVTTAVRDCTESNTAGHVLGRCVVAYSSPAKLPVSTVR